MGRELKRVPLDFQWQLNKVWHGYQMPEELCSDPCEACKQSGYNPATKAIADAWYDGDRFVSFFSLSDTQLAVIAADPFALLSIKEQILELLDAKGGGWTYLYGIAPDGSRADKAPWMVIGDCKRWQHDITQDEVQALIDHNRLYDFTHVWKGHPEGWVRREDGYIPTAAEVNEWSQHGFGHDDINRGICVETRAKRLGIWGLCPVCDGHGEVWRSEEQRAANNAWERTEPPTGDGYQLWETVSEGSPVSPVFATPEELADWLVTPGNDDSVTRGTTREQWLKFIRGPGLAPSMVYTPETGLVAGVQVSE